MINLTKTQQWVIDALREHGALDTGELRSLEGSILRRGLPGHYILQGLEDLGLIQSSLPTPSTRMRRYRLDPVMLKLEDDGDD